MRPPRRVGDFSHRGSRRRPPYWRTPATTSNPTTRWDTAPTARVRPTRPSTLPPTTPLHRSHRRHSPKYPLAVVTHSVCAPISQSAAGEPTGMAKQPRRADSSRHCRQVWPTPARSGSTTRSHVGATTKQDRQPLQRETSPPYPQAALIPATSAVNRRSFAGAPTGMQTLTPATFSCIGLLQMTSAHYRLACTTHAGFAPTALWSAGTCSPTTRPAPNRRVDISVLMDQTGPRQLESSWQLPLHSTTPTGCELIAQSTKTAPSSVGGIFPALGLTFRVANSRRSRLTGRTRALSTSTVPSAVGRTCMYPRFPLRHMVPLRRLP